MKLNQNYANLQESYLFLTIAKKVAAYTEAHPDNHIIRMGIGDVTQPLVPAVIEAMHKATDEMAHKETFHGYSPDQGYDFLREAIQGYYAKRGVALKLSEIFVGDGAKSDVGNIVDIFADDNTVLIPDPVYPVYVDTNVMSGRKVIYLDANEQNGFLGMPDENVKADIIYLCSPNNPTGAVYNRAQLKAWVDYALKNNAVILFDAAYESFITHDDLPHSIFEIEGAKKCAIEFCSFSKTARASSSARRRRTLCSFRSWRITSSFRDRSIFCRARSSSRSISCMFRMCFTAPLTALLLISRCFQHFSILPPFIIPSVLSFFHKNSGQPAYFSRSGSYWSYRFWEEVRP